MRRKVGGRAAVLGHAQAEMCGGNRARGGQGTARETRQLYAHYGRSLPRIALKTIRG